MPRFRSATVLKSQAVYHYKFEEEFDETFYEANSLATKLVETVTRSSIDDCSSRYLNTRPSKRGG